jgi:hypothetical protein
MGEYERGIGAGGGGGGIIVFASSAAKRWPVVPTKFLDSVQY